MAVGMSANIGFIVREPLRVLEVVALLVSLKGLLLFVIGRVYGLPARSARALGVALSQGGEFGFVLFALGRSAGIFDQPTQDLLVVAVTLSMITTPPLYALLSRFSGPELPEARPYDEIDAPENAVIIAGFGPFGQIFGRMLRLKKIPYTVLERNWQHVDFVRQFGSTVFYSDAGRMEVLRAAKADKARFFVLAIADVEESLRIVEMVRRNFPHLRIFAVARDRAHVLQLMDMGVVDVIRRAYGSSLEMTAQLLRALGETEERIARDIERFRRHDHETLLKQQAIHRDEQQLIQTAKEAAKELQQLFEADIGEGLGE